MRFSRLTAQPEVETCLYQCHFQFKPNSALYLSGKHYRLVFGVRGDVVVGIVVIGIVVVLVIVAVVVHCTRVRQRVVGVPLE